MAERFQLANGLTVVLEERHVSPVVAFQAWVGVGSADEPEELAGIAHVFEHMLFKGTARRGVGEIAQQVEGSGGEINAWTSFDQTVFHLVIGSRFFDTGLDILSDALQASSFDPGELERELKVVLEEVKQGEDTPSRIASQMLFSTAYHRHPYRRPVIGTSKTVATFQRSALLDFFRRYYVPANITLAVVGDFDAATARRKIDRAWSAVRPRTAPRVERAPEPAQRAPRITVSAGNVREAHLGVAFHVPGLRHPDTAALDVAAILLGQGDSSRLQIEVKRARQLVSDIYAYSYSPRDPGLLVTGATLPAEQVGGALEAIFDEIFRLTTDDVAPQELDKAKAIVESETIYQKETVQGLARKLGFYETSAGSLAYEEEYRRQVAAITPTSLRSTVAKYLREENCSIALLLPAGAAKPDALEPVLRERLADAGRRAIERRTRKPESAGEMVREVLPGGARVVILRDSSLPLVALRAVWMGGVRAEDAKTNGVNNLLATLLTRGTITMAGDAMAHEIEAMAGSISGFSGRNTFGLRAEVLSRHFQRGLHLFADCLLHPRLAEEELEKERRVVLEELRTQEDNAAAVAFRLFAEALYPKHPYRLDVLGTPASVAGLSRRHLVDYYRDRFPLSEMVLAIVGDVDPRAALGEVRALFARPATRQPKLVSERVPVPSIFGDTQQVFRTLEKQQAHLVLGFPGATIVAPDRFALEVLSTILSGQGGRLFVEVRDKRGLAYRVSAFSLEGVDPGYFAVYVATSPSNLAATETAIRDELNKVIDHPVTAGELERAKRYLVGTHDISLQRRAALASTIAFNEAFGLGWDEYHRYAPGILAVTAADVQRVARKYLAPERAVLAVVKPEELSPAAEKRRTAQPARAPSPSPSPSPPRARPSRARPTHVKRTNHRKR